MGKTSDRTTGSRWVPTQPVKGRAQFPACVFHLIVTFFQLYHTTSQSEDEAVAWKWKLSKFAMQIPDTRSQGID